jgi:alkylated DNA repair dioxygenase AlkB
MNLFEQKAVSVLPYGGEVIYIPHFFELLEADDLYQQLLHEINWQTEEVFIFGKRLTPKRKMAWYADNGINYTYSKSTKMPNAWSPDLLKIREKIQSETASFFNGCLLNLYHHGGDSMGWHADDEKSIVPNSTIASVSLGAERMFHFKHKQTKQLIKIKLEHGSLLLMKGETQQHWLHALPKTTKVEAARINLTFRAMIV